MIEVLFAESEVASMKDVKNDGSYRKNSWMVAVWSARKKKARRRAYGMD